PSWAFPTSISRRGSAWWLPQARHRRSSARFLPTPCASSISPKCAAGCKPREESRRRRRVQPRSVNSSPARSKNGNASGASPASNFSKDFAAKSSAWSTRLSIEVTRKEQDEVRPVGDQRQRKQQRDQERPGFTNERVHVDVGHRHHH